MEQLKKCKSFNVEVRIVACNAPINVNAQRAGGGGEGIDEAF